MNTICHIYTSSGPQRAVFLTAKKKGRFFLSLLPGDEGYIETTSDPIGKHGTHGVLWEAYNGGLAGAVAQITALRVILKRNSGWAELAIETSDLNITQQEAA